MDDWAVGDLALCVRGGKLAPALPHPYGAPVSGAIYKVDAVGSTSFDGVDLPALWFANAPKNRNGEMVWSASRFRKIRPLTDEERESFLADLRVPVGV